VSILDIRVLGDPVLRKPTKPVTQITDELRKLIADMFETMYAAEGIGLAAPQVGRMERLAVVDVEGQKFALINPRVVSTEGEKEKAEEGCLSIPGLRGNINRPLKVTVEATDLDGNTFKEELEGYNARIRMHENDHINGVLFIDRMDEAARKEIEPELRAIKKKFNP